MANRNQLRILTDEQSAEIRALNNGMAVAEIVKVYWPEPTGTIAYAWWNPLSDPIYQDSAFEDWLDGAPLVVAFEAKDEQKAEKFHEIPRTSAIGDDIIEMEFRNEASRSSSLRIDAVTDYYSITSAIPSFPNTIALWVNPQSVGGSVTYSVFTALNNAGLFLGLDENARLLAIWGSTLHYGPTLSLGQWHHVAIVTNAGTDAKRVYLDGALVIDAVESAPSPTGELYLGSNFFNQWADARFAALKIWTAALNQTEIQAEREQFAAVRTADLWGQYALQAAGATLTDESGNGHDFTAPFTGGSVESGPPIDSGGFKFERLCYQYRGGVKVEIFHYLPQVDGGIAISWFLGHLEAPRSIAPDFVQISVAAGFRSPDLLCPNYQHADQCDYYFGGNLTAEEIARNPCRYDRHLGGSRGILNGSDPWTFCERTKEACLRIMGDTLSYGGHDAAADSVLVGAGQHHTVSETVGNETRLQEAKRVVYGSDIVVRNLMLLRYRKEKNPSSSHQDKGTLVTLFEVSAGPIGDFTEVKVMDNDLPRAGGLGLEKRSGTLDQAATGFSPNVLNYNHTALFRGDLNPINPTGIQANQIVGECKVTQGRNTLRIYTDESTFSTGFSNNRAWGALDLLTNLYYGHREDIARHSVDDFIYLATKNSAFNADVRGTKTAQQQFEDICLAGMWFTPFAHNGIIRWLAIETYDLDADDIPTFTDTGPDRNILFYEDGPLAGTPRITIEYRDDKVIPNSVTVNFEDAARGSVQRPLLFPDYEQQARAGEIYGDKSKRKVDASYFALGLTAEDDVRKLGFYILDYGPFYSGGIKNNASVTIAIRGNLPEAYDLHENKVIRIVSDRLDGYNDPNGVPFTHFIVRSLTRTSKYELIVQTQAFAASLRAGCAPLELTNLTKGISPSAGQFLKITGADNCFTDAVGSGDAGARSVRSLSGGNWRLKFSFNSVTEGRVFAGLTTNSAYTTNYTQMRYCIHVSDQDNTVDPHPPHAWFIYENGSLKAFFEDPEDLYVSGDEFTIECVGTTVRYYHRGVLKYTSLTASTSYPLYAAVSVACLNKTVDGLSFCLDEVESGGTTETQDAAPSAIVMVDRLITDEQVAAGVLGFNFGAAPTQREDAWAAASLYCDRGAGFIELVETEDESILGEAVTALAATTVGTETVRVELQPEQELPASGTVWLGGEIFDYADATQVDDVPNRWDITTLTNRGSHCTSARIATHIIGEDFLLLDGSTTFVAVPNAELDQTRDYKIVTAGEDPDDVTDFSFTLNAPNFKPTTPADYAVTYDAGLSQAIHTWSPIGDPCLVGTGLAYEIYLNESGSPGTLLWTGVANMWTEAVDGSPRSYFFRAKNNFANGDYVEGDILGGSGGSLFDEPLFGE